ncbi:unnamed protein product [Trichogramma brassicae]|uniref:C2H2-type domain-containing protein n=1 Tax=Trichogramma brassicae TaxID=86971 RepID=A0A6H5HU09_9HYME|nr:unnamed protein product [Trichogramma brassicae]
MFEKKFGQKQHLLVHQNTVHKDRRDFACDECEKKFGHKSHFLRHQKIVHQGRKDYGCGTCEKKFGQKIDLLKHQKVVHESRKDYACDKFGVIHRYKRCPKMVTLGVKGGLARSPRESKVCPLDAPLRPRRTFRQAGYSRASAARLISFSRLNLERLLFRRNVISNPKHFITLRFIIQSLCNQLNPS